MPRRGENIRKRKDGRWEARYKKGTDKNSKPIYGSVYGKTYREVKEKRVKLLQEGEQQSPKKKDMLFGETAELWLAGNRLRLKGATLYRYHYLIHGHILPTLGNKRLSDITGPVINAFLADKQSNGRLDGKGGLSGAYVRSIMLVISAVIQFAVDERLCPPLQSQICKPSLVRRELPILEDADRQRLESVLLADTDSTKLGVLISLYTGLRIGEICALTWDDIDLDKNVIYVRHTVARVRCPESGTSRLVIDRPKTLSSLRCIPICSRLRTVLVGQARSGFVVSDAEDFLNPRTLEYRYHRLLGTSGVPQVNYHALRHTFATRCIASGVDVKSLSEILGHSNVSTTLGTYVHSSMEQKRTQLEKLVV